MCSRFCSTHQHLNNMKQALFMLSSFMLCWHVQWLARSVLAGWSPIHTCDFSFWDLSVLSRVWILWSIVLLLKLRSLCNASVKINQHIYKWPNKGHSISAFHVFGICPVLIGKWNPSRSFFPFFQFWWCFGLHMSQPDHHRSGKCHFFSAFIMTICHILTRPAIVLRCFLSYFSQFGRAIRLTPGTDARRNSIIQYCMAWVTMST